MNEAAQSTARNPYFSGCFLQVLIRYHALWRVPNDIFILDMCVSQVNHVIFLDKDSEGKTGLSGSHPSGKPGDHLIRYHFIKKEMDLCMGCFKPGECPFCRDTRIRDTGEMKIKKNETVFLLLTTKSNLNHGLL